MLIAGLVTAWIVAADSSSDDAEVLGAVVERDIPTTTTEAAPTTTAPTSTTSVPAPSTTAAPPPTQPPPPPPPPPVVERAATGNSAFFTYTEDPNQRSEGSATTIGPGAGPAVVLSVSGTTRDDVAVLNGVVDNQTGSVIDFPNGLIVRMFIDLDGQPWRTVDLANPAVTALAPGQQAGATAEVLLEQYGQYNLTGEVEFVRR